MSEKCSLGQKRKCRASHVTSALPHKADVDRRDRDVRFVQILLQKSAYRRRGTADTIFLKPSVATRWIVRAAYARLY
jgi:hypothetical protein